MTHVDTAEVYTNISDSRLEGHGINAYPVHCKQCRANYRLYNSR